MPERWRTLTCGRYRDDLWPLRGSLRPQRRRTCQLSDQLLNELCADLASAAALPARPERVRAYAEERIASADTGRYSSDAAQRSVFGSLAGVGHPDDLRVELADHVH
jgi:hypothetical protein